MTGSGLAWRWEAKATTGTLARKTVRCGAEKERRKGLEFPPGWGRQEDSHKESFLQAVEKKEARQEQDVPASGFAALFLTSPALCSVCIKR